MKKKELSEPVARTTCVVEKGWDEKMGDLWVPLFLSLSLAAFRGVKGCLECDPKFIEDVSTLLGNLVPVEVPGRTQLLERQHKEITHLSYEVSHKDKTLRLLGEGSWSPESLGG